MRSKRWRSGAEAVEFGLVLPVLLLLLFVGIDFGWYLHTRNGLIAAAERGVREGSLVEEGSDPGHAEVAEALCEQILEDAGYTGVSCQAWTSGAYPARVLRLSAEVDFHPLTRLVPVLPWTMTFEVTQRTVDQPPP